MDDNPLMVTARGTVFCRKHAQETNTEVKPLVLGADPYGLFECIMCGVKPVEGNRCYREECGKPLHPQWPSVYCSTECAVKDA